MLKLPFLWLILQGSIKLPVAATIFFGANDAALLGRTSERQHVPVEEYKVNLKMVVRHLKVQFFSLLHSSFNIYTLKPVVVFRNAISLYHKQCLRDSQPF